jgi:glycosyltransferase involved in cell wall biosynthesis
MPTVLHLIGTLDQGGTEHQLVEFIRRSSEPDRHLVIAWAGGTALADRLPNPPVWARPAARSGRIRTGLEVIPKVSRVIHARRVDIVHAHLSTSELLAAMATPIGIPIVASRRGRTPVFEDRAWFRTVQWLAHRRVALMLTNSEELARFTLRRDGSTPPLVVIPNGVDLERFVPTPLPQEPVVTMVANLIDYKRHDLLLRALAAASVLVPDARAILVGDGPERPALERLASDLGVSVEFAGRVADVRPFIERARVVALTSDHEGLPNALLEAMAMGRPIVARAVGGVGELVRDGSEGWLTGSDVETIADRLVRALTPSDGQVAMAAAARQRAEFYSWEHVVRRTEDLYRRIAGGERFAPGRRIA